jgi:hypothetical protein
MTKNIENDGVTRNLKATLEGQHSVAKAGVSYTDDVAQDLLDISLYSTP